MRPHCPPSSRVRFFDYVPVNMRITASKKDEPNKTSLSSQWTSHVLQVTHKEDDQGDEQHVGRAPISLRHILGLRSSTRTEHVQNHTRPDTRNAQSGTRLSFPSLQYLPSDLLIVPNSERSPGPWKFVDIRACYVCCQTTTASARMRHPGSPELHRP